MAPRISLFLRDEQAEMREAWVKGGGVEHDTEDGSYRREGGSTKGKGTSYQIHIRVLFSSKKEVDQSLGI